jgi:hypothetical protein
MNRESTRKHRRAWAAWLAAAGLLAAGCGEATLPTLDDVQQAATDAASQAAAEVADQAAQATAQTPSPAGPAAGPGKFELTVGTPVTSAGCYGQLTPAIGPRAAVLQIASYPTADAEVYPSVLLWARLPSGDGTLAGQTVQAQLFVQATQNGPIWYAPDGAEVEVQITSAADGRIAGTILAGTLTTTADGTTAPVSGNFEGSLR